MSEYRGVVFDIDRTAVPNAAQTVESEALKAAFAELDESVIAIAATGRATEVALPITRALDLKHESVVANGALIVDSHTGEIKWQHLLSTSQISQIIKLCLPHDYQLYFAGDGATTYRTAKQQETRPVASAYLKDVPAELAHDVRERVLNVNGVSTYLSQAWGGQHNHLDLNISHEDANKHNALQELFDMYGIDGSEMIGVGDGINDVELFQIVGHRVAVANACPQLIELADEVVPAQEDDGLAVVISRFHN